MTDGLVSVMMPAYNAENYIGRAIESVLAQSYPDWELIIVDDGSTDRTAEIVRSYNDSRIRIFHQTNQGESVARNTALEHSKGAFLAFLDADDMFRSDHLNVTVNFLQSHPEFDAVYTDGFHIDEEGKRLLPLSALRRGPFEGWIFEEVVRASDVIGPPGCILLRIKPVFDESLRYDPSIVIGPDWDFERQYSENHKFGYIDKPTYLYRVHQENITRTTDRLKRSSSLATCRKKAIKSQKFGICSSEVRYRAFYDLLIDLLSEMPEQQSAAISWPEFKDLPQDMQAKLLRLMASKAILIGGDGTQIKSWLRSSLKLNITDWRTTLLQVAYPISPAFCRKFLSAKGSFAEEEAPLSLFDNLNAA